MTNRTPDTDPVVSSYPDPDHDPDYDPDPVTFYMASKVIIRGILMTGAIAGAMFALGWYFI